MPVHGAKGKSMTIENIRLANMRMLAAEVGGQSRFGERVGMSRQLVSNYIGKTPVKHIGSDLARKVERIFDKPHGWLDREHGSGAGAGGGVNIAALDVGGVLGPGRLPMLLDSTVQQMRVSTAWLRDQLGSRPAEYLALATVSGDAMAPALPDGSLVVVDRSESGAKHDGVYMLGRKDADGPGVWFRRVERRLDGKWVISTGRKDDTSVLPNLQKAGIVVLGRVVARLDLTRL